MFNSQHKPAAIDQIIEGFSNKEVLITALSGKIDSRIKELYKVISEVEKLEYSNLTAEKADAKLADAEKINQAAKKNQAESLVILNEAKKQAAAIVAEADSIKDAIKKEKSEATTDAKREADLVIARAKMAAADIRSGISDDIESLKASHEQVKRDLAETNEKLKVSRGSLATIRRAISGANATIESL